MVNVILMTTNSTGDASIFLVLIPIAILIVVFYFLLILPDKKKQKKKNIMQSNVEVSDEIVTAGGIIGKVVSVWEDNIVIETGDNHNRIRVLKTAVVENRSRVNKPEANNNNKKN